MGWVNGGNLCNLFFLPKRSGKVSLECTILYNLLDHIMVGQQLVEPLSESENFVDRNSD
jgi:hypothetical protein